MSDLHVLEKFIDTSVFQQDNYRIPLLVSDNIDNCCKQLHYAITTRSKIFIYGDYDVDGLMSMLVWKSVFKAIGYQNIEFYQYSKRTHAVASDIIEQVQAAGANYVIICDTGSSSDDRFMLRKLRGLQADVIVIDHHVCSYGYKNLVKECCVFNSYEERELLNGDKVSGAYACLLVANVFCTKYLDVVLPSDARYYALASMYSDVVDMSSDTAIALYNNVILQHHPLPTIFQALNNHGYKVGRRFFQYIVSPVLNNCFRSNSFDSLNRIVTETNMYALNSLVKMIGASHEKTRQIVKQLAANVQKESYGAITLCRYDNTLQDNSADLSGYTGLIANMIATEVGGAVCVLTNVDGGYKGSLRDQQGRNFLSAFASFAEVGGHPPAFGIRIAENKLPLFLSSLKVLGNTFSEHAAPKFITISSEYIKTLDDVNILALYNEYMNTKSMVYVGLHCSYVSLQRKTQWYKYYNVGLPVVVKTVTPLLNQSNILLEPCITSTTELREVTV